jgi:hypothetical protein
MNQQIEHFFWTCSECGEQVVRLSEEALGLAKSRHDLRHNIDRLVRPELAIVGSSLQHITAEDRVFLKALKIKVD